MKFFALIMSFFLLYQSCVPCCDSRDCNANYPVKISAFDNHQQHNHQSETCSPFCVCSCCATSVYYSAINQSPHFKAAFHTGKFLLYDPHFNSVIHYSIWEPPKFS